MSLGRGRHPFVTRVESVLRHFPTALGADLASPPITVAVDRGCGGTGWALGQDWGGVSGPGKSAGRARVHGAHGMATGVWGDCSPAGGVWEAASLLSPPTLVVLAGGLRHPWCWNLAGCHPGELRHPVLLLPVPVGRQPAYRYRHLRHGHWLRGLHRGHQGEQVPPAYRECPLLTASAPRRWAPPLGLLLQLCAASRATTAHSRGLWQPLGALLGPPRPAWG